MSKYVWNADTESDAHRIASAKLPAPFWKSLAGIAGDLVNGASGKFEIDGDVLTFNRSYVIVTRDEKRIATLPMKTLLRTNALVKAMQADAKPKKAPDKIVWEP